MAYIHPKEDTTQARIIECHCGTQIYQSLREHAEYVGCATYRVAKDEYFAVVLISALFSSEPDDLEEVLTVSPSLELVKARIDSQPKPHGMSVKEYAWRNGVTNRTVYRWLKSPQTLRAEKRGGGWRIFSMS